MRTTGVRRRLKHALPWAVPLMGRLRAVHVWVRYCARVLLSKIRDPGESVFRSIYQQALWGGGSGGGSDLEQTQAVREQLPELAEQLYVRSVLDAPCGDYRWMSEVDWDLDSYVGVDIVPELIEHNQAQYQTDEVTFLVADITRDRLPRADLVLVRDCFVHMSHRDIRHALRTLKASGSKYLLTTTYPGAVKRNWNIMSGWWRALDFQRPPFNFPAPERIIDEQTTHQFDKPDKSLGLWRFEDLPLG
jgi:SAM-dependent methyltransferase